MKTVTQAAVARRAGVSRQAAAYALEESPKPCSIRLRPETRERVRQIARQMEYVPHQAARNLRLGRTHEIVVATTASLRYAHVHDLIEELQAALASRGYRLDLELFRQINEGPALFRTLTRGRCDGVVLNHVYPEHHAAVESLWQHGLPVVVTTTVNDLAVDTVDYDRPETARLGTAHLLAQGHARVALIVHARGVATEEQRVQGYRQALTEAGRPFEESLILTCAVGADLQPVWQRLTCLTPRPTGIVSSNPELTVQLLGVLRRQGLRVPADIALVSLGDAQVNTLLEVPLTAVDTNPRGMAAAVVERLIERMAHPESPPQHILVKPHLVERESSKYKRQ